MDINKITKAINDDAGQEIADLKQSLLEMKAEEKGRITTPAQLLVREARKQAGYTQPKFAKAIHASLTSLRDWEQGRHEPPGVVTALMTLLKNHPHLIDEL